MVVVARPGWFDRIGVAIVVGLALTAAGCDGHVGAPSAGVGTSCGNGAGFALSLARDTGGERTPVAAATWFAHHGGFPGLPGRGWRVVAHDEAGATVRAGRSTVHAVRGSDGTWLVDGGRQCG